MSPLTAVEHPNVRAFLRAIRLGEGTSDADGYRRLVGGENFDSFADHPRRRIWIDRYQVWSSAAGAYQFLMNTWDEMAQRYKLPDFSPESQDIAAVGLIARRGALEHVLAGRIEEAVRACRREWASLPGSPYGQRTESLERVLAEYLKHGGALESAEKELSMPIVNPLTTLLFNAAAEAIPELIRLRSKSPNGEVNAKTAELALGAIKAATGAVNEQEAVEIIRKDSDARESATKAVREQYYELELSNEASIEEAREFARTWRDGQPFISFRGVNLLFIEFLSLILICIGAYGGFYVLKMSDISNELKGAVITLMLIGGFTGVKDFWFGSSRSSQRKDERLERQ